jgi:CRP-like cAMP-binding protein
MCYIPVAIATVGQNSTCCEWGRERWSDRRTQLNSDRLCLQVTNSPFGPSAVGMKNLLIEALPRRDRDRLLENCEPRELAVGDVLCELDEPIRHVFFPTGSFISQIAPIDAGASLEVGLVGFEGMLGTSLLLDVNIAPQRALVQGGGTAWQIKAAPFCRELQRSLPLRRLANRYLYVTLRQVAQTAGCTHFHIMGARLARWLLMTSDRAQADEFYITHEFMSLMLGVRREGVTAAAGLLQKAKLIEYARGNITILDRRGLKAAACSCYAEAKKTYASMFG